MRYGRITLFASHRWLYIWLVSLFAAGNVVGQVVSFPISLEVGHCPSNPSRYWTGFVEIDYDNNQYRNYRTASSASNIIFEYTRLSGGELLTQEFTGQNTVNTWKAGSAMGGVENLVSVRMRAGDAGCVDSWSEVVYFAGPPPPDYCGPVDLSQVVVNDTPFTQTWAWRTGGSSLLVSATNGASTLGPFSSGTFTLVDSDLCGPIYLVEVGGIDAIPGEATDFYGPFQPDSPDEAPADDPVIVDTPTAPIEFEDTPLQEIEEDVALDDQQKTARQDYVLWRASDSRGAEIVAELKKLNEGGLGEDGTAAIVSELEEHNEREQARQDAQDAILEGNPSAGAQATAGAAAKVDIENAYPSAPSSLGFDPGSGAMPLLTVTMPAAFGGATFDMNPFQSERLKPITDWFRVGVAWLTIVVLGIWVWGEIGEWTRGFSTLQQAKGNAIAAGSGGQATAFAAAGLITVAIVTGTVALVGWAFGDLDVYLFVSTATSNPMATMPAGVYWMIDQVFPIATLLAALVARLAFRMYAAPLFAGVAGVVRFIVP